MDIKTFISQSSSPISELAETLNHTTHEDRVRQTRALSAKELKLLYEQVLGFHALTPEDLISKSVQALTPIRFMGTNSLPVARHFEKTMYRGPDGNLYGRNVQRFSRFTGPGYFSVLRENSAEVVLDYRQLPALAPEAWPKITSNSQGLSYLVFRNLRDVMRRVSKHVFIGHAYRGQVDLKQYFVLVRKD